MTVTTVTAEPVGDLDVPFALEELDLLSAHAGERFPFPLRIPSFGRHTTERAAVLSAAGHALQERGLATDRGPAGLAAEVVTALREYRSAVDLVVVEGAKVTGAVAMVHGGRALVCRQSLGGDRSGAVGIRSVSDSALTDGFSGLIPEIVAASAMPITLPPSVVADTLRLLSNTADTVAPRKAVRRLVKEYGGDENAVERLIELLPAVDGRGQLGVIRRRRSRATRGLEVSWLDSPKGRVRVTTAKDGWTSINPLRKTELVRLLGEAATTART